MFSSERISKRLKYGTALSLLLAKNKLRTHLFSLVLILFSINTLVIIQNRSLSLARYLGLSADNHLDGQNGFQ